MTPTDCLPLAVVGLATLMAAATDLWRFKVYNLLTLPTLAAGLIASTVLGGWPGFVASVLGAGFGFLILLVFYALGGVGAGDVKLLTALGAWLGPSWAMHVFIASALAAGAYAVVLVVLRSGLLGVLVELLEVRRAILDPRSLRRAAAPDLAAEVSRADRRRRLVPFAAMTCVGYFAVLGWWQGQGRLVEVWPPYPMRSAPATRPDSPTPPTVDAPGGADVLIATRSRPGLAPSTVNPEEVR